MSEKETNFSPKHRIIGAIILVSLAVIFIPMVLDESTPPDPDTVSVIPVPDDTPDPEHIAVTAVPGAIDPVSGSESIKSVETPVTMPEPTVTATKPIVDGVPQPTATPPPSIARSESTPSAGWVVQVGTFSNSANATRLEEKLKKKGHLVTHDRIKLDTGQALRLRVGPFRDKSAALKAQADIQKEVGVQGVVLAYP